MEAQKHTSSNTGTESLKRSSSLSQRLNSLWLIHLRPRIEEIKALAARETDDGSRPSECQKTIRP